jgi:hypothetical protein
VLRVDPLVAITADIAQMETANEEDNHFHMDAIVPGVQAGGDGIEWSYGTNHAWSNFL